MKDKKIICWWSGGITSAVACKIAIDLFGLQSCSIVMIDTLNEHEDTYRFKSDCEKWYGKNIEVITDIGKKYESIQDVWIKKKSLNVATGAICSTELKRRVRERWQKENEYDHQVFGFEFDKKEFNRALGISVNHPKAKPIFPLIMFGYDKDKCIQIVQEAGIEIPLMYQLGFKNNNCFGTGCVQGGIGYWKKMQVEFKDKFDKMAEMEHNLTDLKGSPVTMLKDQGAKAKETGNTLVFLKKHPSYPDLKCIDEMLDAKIQPLFECNGFCGTNDFDDPNKTQMEINYES